MNLTSANTLSPLVSLTLGNFDGLHLGHRALIESSVQWAQQNQGKSVVFTFDPHPLQILFPEKNHQRLFDLQDQLEVLKSLGVSEVYVQKFSMEFSKISPQDFFKKYIFDLFHPSHLVVGWDYSFGHSRSGSVKTLFELCTQASPQIQFQQISAQISNQEIVSTSLVKKELAQAHLSRVHELLQRNFSIRGEVVAGLARGRLLGFPTANILSTTNFLPKDGVYATRIKIDNVVYSSVTNIGVNKTFQDTQDLNEILPKKIEVHIFDFSQDIYGKKIELEFIQYLRPEIKFSSLDELKNQIKKDVYLSKEVLL